MELSNKHLNYVLALGRYRHYGRAAEALGVSQPALSRCVIALEKHLGTTLFERSRGGVEATEAGRLVLRHAREVSLLDSGLKAELLEIEGRAKSKLSLVCGHYPSEMTVPGALSALLGERPDTQVDMVVADWSRGVTLLEQGACEIAVIELSATSNVIELGRELLCDQQVFGVVRPTHPLAHADRPTLRDLLEWPWACSRIPERGARYLAPGPIAAGDFDSKTGHFLPKIVASSLSTALRLVTENDIVGITPLTVAAPYLEDGRLALVRHQSSWMRLNYGFAWDTSVAQSATTRTFMDKMREAEQRERERHDALRRKFGIDGW